MGNLLSITRNNSSQTSVIDFNPNSGAIGSTVTIYGTGYSATPSQNTVTFNGVAATVTSSTFTQIAATVPSGATNGAIAVTSPAGSASSSTSFTVTGAPAGAPTITNISPTIGAAGTPVTITGTNFDSTATNNEVRFNPGLATVSTATPTSIATTVPLSAAPGKISVSTSGGTALSAQDFFIPPFSHAAADVVFTERMSIGGPSLTASVNTANKIGLVLFDGVANQRVSLQVTNSNIPATNLSIVAPGGNNLFNPTFVGASGFFEPITLPTTGSYTILIDPQSTYTGSLTLTLFNVAKDVETTITPGGSPVTVTTTSPGQNARATFAANANQRISLRMTGVSIPNTHVSIVKPDQTNLVSPYYVSTNGGFIDSVVIPSAGTYTIFVNPLNLDQGSMTLTLYDVPADYTTTITPGGSPVTVTATVPGQNAKATFSGTENQRVSLQITNVTIPNSDASIQKPDQSNLVSPNYIYSTGIYIDTVILPTTGTYTILINPRDFDLGSVTLTLYDVPADYTTTITPGGSPVTVTNTVPGQNAKATFSGTANQRISLQMTNVTIPNSDVYILKPDQSNLVGATYVGTGGAYVDTVVLPTAGTYTLFVNPRNLDLGSMTLNLYDPVDVTGSLTVNGNALPVSLTILGQRAVLTFNGTNGQSVTVRLTGNTIPYVFVELRRFDGTLLTWDASGSQSFNLSTQTIPATETYSIVVDPQWMNLGNLSVSVTSP